MLVSYLFDCIYLYLLALLIFIYPQKLIHDNHYYR